MASVIREINVVKSGEKFLNFKIMTSFLKSRKFKKKRKNLKKKKNVAKRLYL